jgi:enoyl-[acyl-carrier-protein] reductase (NADH)
LLLAGKRGLIVGIANQRSIAWGCARAFRALGAELAVTYVNDKTRKYVEPLARELDAGIVMPMNVQQAGQASGLRAHREGMGPARFSHALHRLRAQGDAARTRGRRIA